MTTSKIQTRHPLTGQPLVLIGKVAAVLMLAAMVFAFAAGDVSAKKRADPNGDTVVLVDPTPSPTPTVGFIVDPLPIAPTGGTIVDPPPAATPQPAINVDPLPRSPDSGVIVDPIPGGATIILNVHGCPTGYDVLNPDMYAAAADCQRTIDPVTFHLYDNAGDHVQSTSWLATWHDVVHGTDLLKEEIPVSDKRPFAYCRYDQNGFQRADVGGGSLKLDINDGQTLYCDWYVTPRFKFAGGDITATSSGTVKQADPAPSEPASLFINATACPAGYAAATASIYDLAANCHDAAPLTTIWVGDGTNSTIYSHTAGVSVSLLAPGLKQIVYEIPAGYAEPRVFCVENQLDDASPEVEVDFSGSIFHLNVGAGALAYCDLIAIPAGAQGTASVVSVSALCDVPALNGDFSHANLAASCGPLSDVHVTASANGHPLGLADTLGGAAIIGGLPAGQLHLFAYSSSIYLGTVTPIVFCNISGIGNDQQVLVNTDGSFDLTVADGETVNCHWFFLMDSSVPEKGFTVDARADGPVAVSGDDLAPKGGDTPTADTAGAAAPEPVQIISPLASRDGDRSR